MSASFLYIYILLINFQRPAHKPLPLIFLWFFQHFFRGFLRKYIRFFFLFFVGKGIRQQLQRGREHQFLPQRQLVSQQFLVGSRERQHLAQQQCGRQFLPQQFREQLSQQCFF